MGQGSPKSPSRRQARGSTSAGAGNSNGKKINFNSMRLTALNEDHLSRFHPKLQEIMMMNNSIQFLPDNFFDAVPALEYFDASFNALKKIPPSIGNCIRLKQIQLNQNQIGEIPPEIAELSDLTVLDLSANQIKEFIPELANLENLERLDLSSNFLDSVPDDIVALSNLQALRVRGNQLKSVSEQLSHLPMLEILDLRHNFLEALSPNLLLTALERLQLSYNNLTEIPENFANCSSLIELEVSNNRLQSLCDVGAFQYLRRLDLENNVLKRLPDSFGQLESLLDLNLNDNQLEELPENIGDLQSLTSLSLRNNKLSTLPASIGKLIHLENLDLANNELRKLPKELGYLIGLDRLNLDENFFKALPTSFSGLTKLKTFGVGMNGALNDDGIKPGTFAGMISLVELRVFGTSLTQIPSDVCGMTLLERIFMGNNKLTSIPDELSRLMRLQHLYLSANELTVFPKPILALTNLHGLWLNNNKIKSIPEEISTLRDLETLDISENKLKKLPSALGQLKYLHELNIARNSIKMIPATIGGCDELVALDASYNPIEQIPRELRGLMALMHVKFAFCNISEIADVAEGEFIGLRWLCLEGNPITRIPLKLQGVTDIRDEIYLHERKKAELDDDVPIQIVGLPEKKTDLFDIDISEMQGIRPTMEDSILIKDATPLQVDKYQFKLIAVFDGHADSRAAEYCAINFHQFVEDELKRTLTRRMRMIRRESKRRMKTQGIVGLNGGAAAAGPARIRSESDKGPTLDPPQSPEKVANKKRGQSSAAAATSPKSESPVSSPSKRSKKTSKKKAGTESDPTSEASSSVISPSPSLGDIPSLNSDGALTLDLDKVVPQAIQITFDRIRESVFDKEIKSGCTAAMVLLFGNKLWFVSCGDARAVVSIDKVAKRGTRDHKALDADERMRVQKIGGFLAENGRLMGKIAVSRAIGDQEFWPYVTSDPYIHQETLTEKHEFLIVACDGVWDVLCDQRACDIVRNHYEATGSYHGSANVLRDVSYQLGSGDNISVIVVGLKTQA